MARKAVVDAVEARLAANWTTTTIIGALTAGDPPANVPPAGGDTPFVLVDYPAATEGMSSIGAPGNNWWREEGVFRVVIHGARGFGLSTVLTWADTIAAIFRGQLFSNVQCWEVDSATIGDRNDRGGYVQVAVAVRYTHYIAG